jgi:L-fuconate dehydratase
MTKNKFATKSIVASAQERLATLEASGYPAYTTSAGWFGFNDEKIRALCRERIADGWTHLKLKIGGEPSDDLRRGHIMRSEIGPSNKMMDIADDASRAAYAVVRGELDRLRVQWHAGRS